MSELGIYLEKRKWKLKNYLFHLFFQQIMMDAGNNLQSFCTPH